MSDNGGKSYSSFKYQYYLVIFLDILGQKEDLSQMTVIPTTEAEIKYFEDLATKTVGKVTEVKKHFTEMFDKIEANAKKTCFSQNLNSFSKPHIIFYGISDSLIIAAPLGEEENPTPIRDMYSALLATCGLGLEMLSAKIAIRGGLDVSTATRIGENEIYGHAVASAHHIESQFAEYPRFVIGDGLINYLREVVKKESTVPKEENNKSFAQLSLEMIVQDSDGRYMLDYLGVLLQKKSPTKTLFSRLAKNAFDFVNAQQEKFVKENNHKLALRYHRLKSYFESRRSLWE